MRANLIYNVVAAASHTSIHWNVDRKQKNKQFKKKINDNRWETWLQKFGLFASAYFMLRYWWTIFFAFLIWCEMWTWQTCLKASPDWSSLLLSTTPSYVCTYFLLLLLFGKECSIIPVVTVQKKAKHLKSYIIMDLFSNIVAVVALICIHSEWVWDKYSTKKKRKERKMNLN